MKPDDTNSSGDIRYTSYGRITQFGSTCSTHLSSMINTTEVISLIRWCLNWLKRQEEDGFVETRIRKYPWTYVTPFSHNSRQLKMVFTNLRFFSILLLWALVSIAVLYAAPSLIEYREVMNSLKWEYIHSICRRYCNVATSKVHNKEIIS